MRLLNTLELNAISGGFNAENANKMMGEFTFSQFLEAVADVVATGADNPQALIAAYPWMEQYIAYQY